MKHSCALLASTALAIFTTQSVWAQDAAPAASVSQSGIGEIVVTAQKRAESLQDVPISIAAMTTEDLERRGVKDITDLRAEVPSLQVTPHPNSSTTSRVYIRGIGNNDDQITQDPSVAVYLDGVYVARSQGLSAEVADIERIEVLRGPQGALYGRNATGGAINYITKAPDLGKLGGAQSFTVGNYDQFRSRSRINIPIGETFAFELAYLHSRRNGFVDNPGPGVSRYGDERRDAYRAAALWQPSDALSVRYTFDRSEINDTPSFLAPVPLYPEREERPSEGSPYVSGLKRDDVALWGHNLTVNWDVSDEVSIRSITGHRKLDSNTYQTYIAGVLGPFEAMQTDFHQKQKQFTQELQLVGDAYDGRLEYVIGAYYFDEKADSFDTARIIGVPQQDRTVTIHNRAYAVFSQATVRPAFLDGLYVTPSLRWSRDERRATLQNTFIPAGADPIVEPNTVGDRNFSNVSPGLVIGYEVGDVNVYAKYAAGYKTGGYNVRASSRAKFSEGFGDETLDSYEVGVKTTLLDRRLRFNVAAFLLDYKDIQVNLNVDPINPSVTDIFNAGVAKVKGIEIDVNARPVEGLSLNLSYSYVDPEYKRITDPVTGANIASRFDFVESPKNTLIIGGEYQFPETGFGLLTANAQYFYQSKKRTGSPDETQMVVGSYGLLDARLTLSEIPVGWGDWKLSVYGKNLTNKDYYVAHFGAFVPVAIFGQPRTYGLELSFKF